MHANIIQKNPVLFYGERRPSNQDQGTISGCSFGEILEQSENSRPEKDPSGKADAPGLAGAKFRLNGADKTDTAVDAKMRKKIETAINWLARYLGIKPGILLAVFDELGIDPNDMADPTKFVKIVERIADYFNLDDEQKKEIRREMAGILGFQC